MAAAGVASAIDGRIIAYTNALRKAATSWANRRPAQSLLQPSLAADGAWTLLFENMDQVAAVEAGSADPPKQVFLPVGKVSELTNGFIPTLRFSKHEQVVVAAIVCNLTERLVPEGGSPFLPPSVGGTDTTFHAFFVVAPQNGVAAHADDAVDEHLRKRGRRREGEDE
jgi:hypothetical protein